MIRQAVLLIGIVGVGCSDDPAAPHPTEFGGERPAYLEAPDTLGGGALPLVLVLHGYGANAFVQTAYFQAKQFAKSGDALVLAPDGTLDATGKQFWNADEACCDFGNTGVDDVAYLGGLIDDVRAAYPVSDVFVIGHSNGGYMAYRMACERADAISAIISLAGNAATTPANCHPSEPVSVLHMHGTNDEVVPFTGAPGADGSVQQWVDHDHCSLTRTPGAALDLETSIAGSETTRATVDGCPAGIGVELWSIEGAMHVPNFGPMFGTTWFDWFTAHAR